MTKTDTKGWLFKKGNAYWKKSSVGRKNKNKERFIIAIRKNPVRTITEACRREQMSTCTVYNWINEDELFARDIDSFVIRKKIKVGGKPFKKGNTFGKKGRPKKTPNELSLMRVEKWRAKRDYVEKSMSESYATNKARELKVNVKNCERCGGDEGLQVHHKDRNRKNYKLENILKVCKKCHVKIHVDAGDWGNSKKMKYKKTLTNA